MVDSILRLQIKIQAAEAVKGLQTVEAAVRQLQATNVGGAGLTEMNSQLGVTASRLAASTAEAEKLKLAMASINVNLGAIGAGTLGVASSKYSPAIAQKEAAAAAAALAKEEAAAVKAAQADEVAARRAAAEAAKVSMAETAAAAKAASKEEMTASKEQMAYQKAVWAQTVADAKAAATEEAAAVAAASKEAEAARKETLAFNKAVFTANVAEARAAAAEEAAVVVAATKEAEAARREELAFNKAVFASNVANRKVELAEELAAQKEASAAAKAVITSQIAEQSAAMKVMATETAGAQKAMTAASLTHSTFSNAFLANQDIKINGAMDRTRRGLLAMGKDLQWIGRQINFNFTLPLLFAAGVMTKMALANENAFISLRKVYGNGSSEMTAELMQVQKGLRMLSDYYGIAQAKVIDLGAQWAAAGATGSDLMKLVETSIKLSMIGQYASPADTFNDLVTIQNAYHLSTKQLDQAIASLNTTANITAATLPQLVTGITKVGGVANLAGVDISHLSAMMAVLVPATGSAENAGNSLKTILSRLMAPTKGTIEVLKSLGIEWSGAFKDLTGTQKLELIASKYKDLTGTQKAYVDSTIGSRWQINKLAVLFDAMSRSTSDYYKVLAATNPSQDANNTARVTREIGLLLKSDPKQFQILITQIKNMLTETILPLLPAFMFMLKVVRSIVGWFAGLGDGTQRMIFIALGLVMAVGIISQAVGSLQLLYGAAIKGILGFLRIFGIMTVDVETGAAEIIASNEAATSELVASIESLKAELVSLSAVAQTAVAESAVAADVSLAESAAAASAVMTTLTAEQQAVIATAWAVATGEVATGAAAVAAESVSALAVLTSEQEAILAGSWAAIVGAAGVAAVELETILAGSAAAGVGIVAEGALAEEAVVAATAAASGGIFAAFAGFIVGVASAAWALIAASPVIAIVAAVAAVIAVIVIFRKQIWDMFEAIGRFVVGVFGMLPDAVKSVFTNILTIIRSALDAIENWFSSLFGGGKKSIAVPSITTGGTPTHASAPTHRAVGGHVSSRNPYIIGELGPELFTPMGSGNITTAHQTTQALTGLAAERIKAANAIKAANTAQAAAADIQPTGTNWWERATGLTPTNAAKIASTAQTSAADTQSANGQGASTATAAAAPYTGPMDGVPGGVKNNLAAFDASVKPAKTMLAAADAADQKAKITAISPQSGALVDALNADLVTLRANLEPIEAAMKAQEIVVKAASDAYNEADHKVSDFSNSMKPLAARVDALKKAMDKASSAISDFASTPIEGMKKMGDAIFDNEIAQKKLRLEIMKIEDAGNGFDKIQTKIAAVNGQMESLRGTAANLRAAGAGSDVLQAYDQQINALQNQADQLGQTAQSTTKLTDQLALLQRQGEKLNLEQSLQFDPLTKQIQDLSSTTKELSFDAIVKGIKDQKTNLIALTAAYTPQLAALDAQQATLDKLTLTRDALKVTYDNESASLAAIKEQYAQYDDQIKSIDQALSDASGSASKLTQAAKSAASTLDQLGNSSADTAAQLAIPDGTTTSMADWLTNMQKMMDGVDLNPFKGWGDKIKKWLVDHIPEILSGIGIAIALLFAGVPLLIAAAIGAIWVVVSGMVDWSKLGDLFMKGLDAIGRFFADLPGTIWGWVKDASTWLYQTGIDLMGGLGQAIDDKTTDIATWFADLPGKIWDWVKDAATWLYQTGVNLLTGFANGIVDTTTLVATWFADLPGKIWDWVKDAPTWLYDTGKNVIVGMVTGYIDTEIAIATWLLELPGKILGWIGDAASWLYTKGTDIVGGIVSGLGDAAIGVAQFFLNLPGNIVNWMSGASTWLTGVGGDILQGLWDGITGGLNSAGGFVADLGRGIANALIDAWNFVATKINDFIPNSLGWGLFSIDLPDNPIPTMGKLHSGGWVDPTKGSEQIFKLAANEFVFTPAQTIALARLGIGNQTATQQTGSTTMNHQLNFYGDLSFPNITNEHDAEGFLSNLEAMAGA